MKDSPASAWEALVPSNSDDLGERRREARAIYTRLVAKGGERFAEEIRAHIAAVHDDQHGFWRENIKSWRQLHNGAVRALAEVRRALTALLEIHNVAQREVGSWRLFEALLSDYADEQMGTSRAETQHFARSGIAALDGVDRAKESAAIFELALKTLDRDALLRYATSRLGDLSERSPRGNPIVQRNSRIRAALKAAGVTRRDTDAILSTFGLVTFRPRPRGR